MLSLREMLWLYLYGGDTPDSLATKEILSSLGVFVVLFLLYFPLKKIIFYSINPDARRSRLGAILLAGSLAVAWLVSSLDLLGLFSFVFALVIAAVFILVDGTYLLLTRGKA